MDHYSGGGNPGDGEKRDVGVPRGPGGPPHHGGLWLLQPDGDGWGFGGAEGEFDGGFAGGYETAGHDGR